MGLSLRYLVAEDDRDDRTVTRVAQTTCRAPQAADGAPTFKITTTPNPKQRRALKLLNAIRL